MFPQNIAKIAQKITALAKTNMQLKRAISIVRHIPTPEKGSKEFHRGWDAAIREIDKTFSDLGH